MTDAPFTVDVVVTVVVSYIERGHVLVGGTAIVTAVLTITIGELTIVLGMVEDIDCRVPAGWCVKPDTGAISDNVPCVLMVAIGKSV